jgi:hypothetical protein
MGINERVNNVLPERDDREFTEYRALFFTKVSGLEYHLDNLSAINTQED